MAVIAMAGSFGGAVLAANLPASVFKPIIVVALVAVALFTAFSPNVGELTSAAARRPPALRGGVPDRRR